MNNIDKQYQNLLQDILDNGVEKKDRTGTGTISVFGRQIRHKMSEGFPLLTTKRMAFKTMVVELLWFLRGDSDIRYLWKNGCSIWDGDWYKSYSSSCSNPYSLSEMKEFALFPEKYPIRSKHFDEYIWSLGPIYGKQWRSWYGGIGLDDDEYNIDQIQNLINELKTNPDSRRLMVSAWNVGELDQMTLPPCHYGFQLWTRELSVEERIELANKKYPHFDIFDFGIPAQITHETIDELYPVPKRAVSLMWNQRSVDTLLGLPFNIASYGLLLLMIADEVGMVADELIGNLGDTHLYLNHIEQAKEQISRTPYPLPTVHIRDGIYCSSVNDIILKNYQSHPKITAPLSN